jgi:hypothetical protein
MGSIEFELSRGGSVREELTRAFTMSNVRNAYKPIVMGADRHGTLAWEAAKNDTRSRARRKDGVLDLVERVRGCRRSKRERIA